jgi:hypothetical protein
MRLNEQVLKRIKLKISTMMPAKKQKTELTYYERHGVEPSQELILHALSCLLTKTPYHPILWALYSTCRYLRLYKYPPNVDEVVIKEYWWTNKSWVGGCFTDIHDIIAIDEKNTQAVLITLNGLSGYDTPCLYIIPCEWIKRTFARKNWLVLAKFDFCCRQVLRRSDTGVVRCQSHTVAERYLFDETYFHVGCAPCLNDMQYIFANHNIFMSLANMMKMMENSNFDNLADMMYALGQYEEELC